MLGLIRRNRSSGGLARRFSWDDLIEQVNYLGQLYPLGLQFSMEADGEEEVARNFEGFVDIYRTSGPVFSCILARMYLFAEARFQFQQFNDGRPGELFGSKRLARLEKPWPGGTTGEMLSRAEQDVSLAGNWFLHELDEETLRRLRPDWVTIILGSRLQVEDINKAIDATVIGYAYEPPGERRTFIGVEDMVHWSPIPDPGAQYRGMSWIVPALTDVQADRSSAIHKQSFFRNSATPNFVVLPDKDNDIEEFRDFRDDFTENYEGEWNAYKTIFLGGGSDVKVLGLDFEKMDYRNVQGAGETRIASAANVPPIIAGFSQGLEAATYSNYGQARRKFGDHFARPQWRSVSGAIEPFVSTPRGSRLWYDDRDIPFLREDLSDEAEIRTKDAATIRTLIDGGYKPDAAVEFVRTSNLAALTGEHTGKVPVQLNPADGDEDGSGDDDEQPTDDPDEANGDAEDDSEDDE